MLRSLFSGISGLRAHQTMLDVTGNNIANVNTTGYKASQTQFQDTLSQLLTGAGGAQDGRGGTNPAQIGLGVRVAGITSNFTQGSAQLTNRTTDMMISGDGFFVVRRGNETLYTRAGSFDFDATGMMTLPGDGALVQGWMAVNGVIDMNAPLTDLRIPVGALMAAQQTSTAVYEGNLQADAPDGLILNRDVVVYDSQGNEGLLSLQFTKTATGWEVFDGATTQPVTFDTTTGALTGPLTWNADVTTAIGTMQVAVDLSTVTGFAGVDTIKNKMQDGYAAGTLTSFQLGADGSITGTFTNSLKQVIGMIALANFNNPAGLEKVGGSLFTTTVNSGGAQVGAAGSGGRGSLSGGTLEMSNVDLSSEFTSLIIAQRGFQANSRVITTSDEILHELINLKR
ncbi:MAG: flagellar hook protein FlgE [Micrococcales bacterium]|nr:flagellar hook protein FlgE [Micrococcales bacterium]MCL2667244.1 flagellar hook protein FlgE [Micrococcales bacterium]